MFDMIKTYEEFVNEQRSKKFSKSPITKDMEKILNDSIDYLRTLGLNDEECKEFYNISKDCIESDYDGFIYNRYDIESILQRLSGCDTIAGVYNALKTVFYGDYRDLEKWKKMYGDCPVEYGNYLGSMRLVFGELYLIDGDDYYVEYQDMEDVYGKYDVEEVLGYEEIDLDKEYNWKYDGHLEHLK